jgi:hypothetical protein
MSRRRKDSFEEFRRKRRAAEPQLSHSAPESGNLSQDEIVDVEAGLTAMRSLHKTFDLWVAVGRAVVTLRGKADRMGGRQTFRRLLDQQGFGDLDKATATRLLQILDRLAEVIPWHESLPAKQRREWASPSTVFKHCPVFCKPATEQEKRRRTRAEA